MKRSPCGFQSARARGIKRRSLVNPMRYILTGLALLTATLPAQHAPKEPFGHSRHGDVFDEGPRQAARELPGMSAQVHLPVAGLRDAAQRCFDQGVTQLHGFWYFEAERSFREVAKLHPDCAMAYWGMAMANVENGARAAGFIANAVERSALVPRYEQLWIDAWASYYGIDDARRKDLRSGVAARVLAQKTALAAQNKRREKEAKEKLDRQLIKDLGTLVHEFPQDIEAKAFLVVQNWLAYDWGAGIAIVSHTALDALLDQVFAKAPLHPAHHYRIHLWDQEKPERALRSAAVNGDTAPGIAHQWHMSGHIYARLHRHAEAAWQQEASARVDHAHMLRDRVMPFEIHNYGHNQEWLCRSLSHQGRVAEALEVALNLAELPRHPEKNKVGDREHIAGYARERLVDLCEDYELWTEAVQLCGDGHLDPAEDAVADRLRLQLLGRALFRLGRLEEAERVLADTEPLLARARAERARALDQAEDQAIADKADRKQIDKALDEARKRSTDVVRAVQDLQRELRAERMLAKGDAKGAVAEFAGIEGFAKPLLADAYLAAGQAEKAIAVLEPEVEKHPRRLPTLARLVLAYRAAAKPEFAERLQKRVTELAAMTPSDSPLLRRLGPGTGTNPAAAAGFAADFGPRPPLDTLGPRHWHPAAAPALDLQSTEGGRRGLGTAPGRATLVVFYLGFGCLHCVEQLQAFAPKAKAFAAAGIDIVAIGTDTAAKAAESLAALPAAERFAFPLLADPELAAFKAWRCYDDFERMPLHGTFLVDGDGLVRWQDISFQPFTRVEWLLRECQRLLALPAAAGTGAKQRPG